MSFLSPVWLWSLLALLPLTAIYLLKVRPQRKKTNAYFLWEKVFEERRTSALFQRLRDIFSLILMLLAFVAVCVALARPRLTSEEDKDLLIVIDTSASMQAVAGRGKRIRLAKDQAKDMIRAMNGDRRAAIATLDDQLRFRTHLTNNPKVLLDSISKISASDLPLSPQAARGLLGFTSQGIKEHRVIFLTDGSANLPTLDDDIEIRTVGEAGENLGIIAADMQWIPGKAESANFYVRIENSFDKPVEAELELRHALTGAIGKLVAVKLAKRESYNSVFELSHAEAGPWVASLTLNNGEKDALELDDMVTLGLNERQPIHVAIHVENPWFFQNCVQAFSRSGGLLRLKNEGAMLTLSEKNIENDTPFSIVFKPQGESLWWSDYGDELSGVVPKVLYPDHPLTRHLDLNGIHFSGAHKLSAPKGSVVFIEAQDGTPLLYKISHKGKTAVVINMDPSLNDFFLSPWFPVIVHSASLHLVGRESKLAAVYSTGDIFTIPGAQSDAEIKFPDGKIESHPCGSEIHLLKAGTYFCSSENNSWTFGAALLSSVDSQLHTIKVDSESELATGWPTSLWLLVVAIVVLIVESILYHRRKVG
jgi:hypothetical protein